jgi:hypothetical protein
LVEVTRSDSLDGGVRVTGEEHNTQPNKRSASCVKPRVVGKQLKELQRENARLKRMLADEIPLGDGSVFYRVVEQ